MPQTLYASFVDAQLAQRAVGALIDRGILAQDVSLLTAKSLQAAGGTAVPAATAAGGATSSAGTVPGVNDPGDTVIYADQVPPAAPESVVVPVVAPPLASTGPAGAVPGGAAAVPSPPLATSIPPGTPVADPRTLEVAQALRATAAAQRQDAVRAQDMGDNVASARFDAEANRLAVEADIQERIATGGGRASGAVLPGETPFTTVGPNIGGATTTPAAVPVVPVPVSPEAAVVTPPETSEPFDRETAAKSGFTVTTGADVQAGALKGAEVGLGLGILAGLAVLFVPGIGLVAGGGAIAAACIAALATTAAGGIAGSVVGLLQDQGVPAHAAKHYDDAVAHGGAMIAVHVPSNGITAADVRLVIDKYGATNVAVY